MHPASVGPYRIERELGRGGMGQVYLAHDTRLDRRVAIKALPEHFAQDPDRLARFQREARVLASLSHPGIGAIHGLEEADGRQYLILEFIAGETLAERLARGPMSVDEALAIAKRMAEALEAAHEKGVVHRDLKPGNVMVTPDGAIKVLDFGLARTEGDSSTSTVGAPADSPTVTTPVRDSPTIPGAIMGTAGYMSPEQARGRAVDKRSDVFSFGCVLYEMLAGANPFAGETVGDAIGAVLHKEIPFDGLPPDVPIRARRVLERCLARDRSDRWRDMGDVRILLAEAADEPASEPSAGASRRTRWSAAVLLGAGALIGALAATTGHRLASPAAAPPSNLPLRKFLLPVPLYEGRNNYSFPKISPDGRYVVYQVGNRLMLRDLRQTDASEVPGSQGGSSPFWSPDSRQIAFAKDRRLHRWTIGGGQPVEVCSVQSRDGTILGGAWGRDGRICFAAWRDGIYVVPELGGEAQLLAAPESNEVDFHTPELLPDGRHLIAVAHRADGSENPVVVLSVADGARRTLRAFDGLGSVLYSSSGHVLLSRDVRGMRLLAAPFSVESLDFTGEPFVVAAGAQGTSIAEDGTLTYILGVSHVLREVVWIDRDGTASPALSSSYRGLIEPALSPDGRKLAVTVDADTGTRSDIWIHDLELGTRRRATSGPGEEVNATWVGDNRIVYVEMDANWAGGNVHMLDLDRPDSAIKIGPGWEPVASKEGRSVICTIERRGKSMLWEYDVASPSVPDWSNAPRGALECSAQISPAGDLIAIASDAPGTWEIFVRRGIDGAESRQVSTRGGFWPFWSKTGEALYYWQDDTLMSARLLDRDTMRFAPPERVLSAAEMRLDVVPTLNEKPPVDVAPDGRFLVVRRSPEDRFSGIILVENWYEEFRAR